MKKSLLFLLLCGSIVTYLSCNSSTDKKNAADSTASNDPEEVAKKSKTPAKPVENLKPPIINITDTVANKSLVLYLKDSVSGRDRLAGKLATNFVIRLGGLLKKSGSKINGTPMAWFLNDKAPYFFEAGIPIDKKPNKMPPQLHLRELGNDSVTVAHFYGPYEQIPMAYDAVKDWLKSRKKSLNGKPYEVYVGSPLDKDGKPINPYKVQTDIIFPWK
jgi:effector-binding domain-containing protein